MNWLLDQLFGKRLEQQTQRYLRDLALSATVSSRKAATELVHRLSSELGPSGTLGETTWGESVMVPLAEIVKAHSLVTGGSGSGKSFFALLILKSLIDSAADGLATGFGVIDPKTDLFQGALFLLQTRINHLEAHDPQAADELRRRIVIHDFSSRDPVSSYNILARWPDTEPDFFASNRADLLLDLLEGDDKLSLGGAGVLQKLFMLLTEFNLPITSLDDVLHDERLRKRLLDRCRNSTVSRYFARQFQSVPTRTLAAIERRMQALFASEGVRLSLGGLTAPDWRQYQDESSIVLINFFGENISRRVRRLLQALVMADVGQSIFARREKDKPFLWLCDEAQNFFLTPNSREHMSDLLAMSRSFGSYFLCLTQNMASAVQDPRILTILHTNIRWSFSMRGEPSDCVFLKSALPVTGRRIRPQADPFQEKVFYSLAEERALLLDEVAHLPDRTGYLWFKSRSAEAIKIKTQELEMPQGVDLKLATESIRRDPSIGMRISRNEYERLIAERDCHWTEEKSDLPANLQQAYRRGRGKAE